MDTDTAITVTAVTATADAMGIIMPADITMNTATLRTWRRSSIAER